MPTELECKIGLSAPSATALIARLSELDAVGAGVASEQNYLFDAAGALLARREILRLRVIDCGRGGILTHKRPVENAIYKERVEIETAVADAEKTREIIIALGFTPVFYYEKKRRAWRLDDHLITLDELPQLGFFVEIEASNNAELDALISRLGLNRADNSTQSYPQLWRDYATAHNLPERECRF
jgi:adenylate cyclase class 2